MGNSIKKTKTIFEWNESLSVGVAVLDDDHKMFFEMAEQLNEIVLSKSSEPYVTDSIIIMLEEYIEVHFCREEDALLKTDRECYEEHKRLHDAFRRRFRQIVKSYQTGDLTALQQSPILVANWINDHIKKVDLQYKQIILNKNIDNRPLGVLVGIQENG